METRRKRRGMRSRVGDRGGVGEAPLVLINRNAELGNVSDSGGQTSPDACQGHVCFSSQASYWKKKRLRFHKGCLAVFMLVSRIHRKFFPGAQI